MRVRHGGRRARIARAAGQQVADRELAPLCSADADDQADAVRRATPAEGHRSDLRVAHERRGGEGPGAVTPHRARVALLALAVLGAVAGRAEAYPQFQLSRDQTCTGCHVSPAGGGLLNENGLTTAETMSQWGTPAGFFYDKVPTPAWLMLGGDLRGASGYVQSPEKLVASFPMQIEAYARAAFGSGLSLQVDVGARESQVGKEASTHVWSREHYLT